MPPASTAAEPPSAAIEKAIGSVNRLVTQMRFHKGGDDTATMVSGLQQHLASLRRLAASLAPGDAAAGSQPPSGAGGDAAAPLDATSKAQVLEHASAAPGGSPGSLGEPRPVSAGDADAAAGYSPGSAFRASLAETRRLKELLEGEVAARRKAEEELAAVRREVTLLHEGDAPSAGKLATAEPTVAALIARSGEDWELDLAFAMQEELAATVEALKGEGSEGEAPDAECAAKRKEELSMARALQAEVTAEVERLSFKRKPTRARKPSPLAGPPTAVVDSLTAGSSAEEAEAQRPGALTGALDGFLVAKSVSTAADGIDAGVLAGSEEGGVDMTGVPPGADPFGGPPSSSSDDEDEPEADGGRGGKAVKFREPSFRKGDDAKAERAKLLHARSSCLTSHLVTPAAHARRLDPSKLADGAPGSRTVGSNPRRLGESVDGDSFKKKSAFVRPSSPSSDGEGGGMKRASNQKSKLSSLGSIALGR